MEVKWKLADKTLIQVDMASLSAENNSFDVMTLYRYLTLLERSKKVTKYDLSYSEVTRASDGGQQDGFDVKVTTPHRFKPIGEGNKAPSCKSFFADCISQVEASNIVEGVFRFRFERVNAVTKIQKPYCILSRSISLQPGKPVQAQLF